jgi:NTE family protein
VTALVLQGGGALGAYQGGAFEGLVAAGKTLDWVAGISIGAINSALIAGNPPDRHVDRLRAFWERITAGIPSHAWAARDAPTRAWANEWAAAWAVAFGLPGFFQPHAGPAAWLGEQDRPSIYDTRPLHETLSELVDFDRLNDGPMRLSVGAVDVASGNFVYFDNRQMRLGPEHIMASGALPPGFPAVTLGGHAYWDGGLVSNTPLRQVVENLDADTATVFQVDLFSARGQQPHTLAQVAEREKDIRFSSRTRAVTDMLRERHEMHRRIRLLAALLPASKRAEPQVQRLIAGTVDTAVTLVHLIHRHKGYETQSKDYEFSRTSMLEHWQVGQRDMIHSLRELAAAPTHDGPGSFRVFDYVPDPHEGVPR